MFAKTLKIMKKTITTLAIISSLVLGAQTKDKKVGIQLGGGLNQAYSELGNGFFDFGIAKYGFASANIGYYLNKSFDANLGGSYGETGYYTSDSSKLNMFGRMGQGQLALKYKLANGYLLKENSKIMPYLYIGGGLSNFKDVNSVINRIKNGSFATANAGAGISFMLAKNLYLTYNLGYIWNNTDLLDFNSKGSSDQNLQHGLTIGFNLGAPKDDDKDGIPNAIDKCPGTGTGVRVDALGCPVDKDNDGVADYMDKCPDIAGVANLAGCPDKDGDGITDAEDKCPSIPGIAAFNGCPDSDGDGITDADDKCPTEKGLATLSGCPDGDGDGVTDKDDACPTIKGLANLNGCIDTDNDGVADNLDACPKVAGTIANKGCPEVKEEVKKLFSQALTGVQFESGKDIIKKSSYGILNQVVKVMQDNGEYKLNIAGHTDSQGDDAKNLDLSQRRADAVKKYLTDNKIDGVRILSSKGYGETVPVADNAKPAGRALNRRVEFKVEF
jgi:outer membrane protein OmpA-like peptidoglycan-associated protein